MRTSYYNCYNGPKHWLLELIPYVSVSSRTDIGSDKQIVRITLAWLVWSWYIEWGSHEH